MTDQVDQIAQAILVASDPTQIQLHPQALAFIQSAFKDSSDSWRTALALILDVNPDGSRKHHPQVRFYALRVLDDYLDNSFDPLPPDVFTPLRQAILEYIQNEYVLGNAEANAPCEFLPPQRHACVTMSHNRPYNLLLLVLNRYSK